MTRLADGRFDVRVRLWDVVRNQDMGGQSRAVAARDLRLAAHRIADFVYEKMTGDKGIFSTRIAYITKGKGYTCGLPMQTSENPQSALTSPEPSFHRPGHPTG